MFEHLVKYRNIIVSGPPRSGTRICTKMIAEDTKFKYLQEQATGLKIECLKNIIETDNSCVIQYPMLFSSLRHIQKLPLSKDIVFVIMLRRISEICHSRHRVNMDRNHARVVEDYRLWNDDVKPFLSSVSNISEIQYTSLYDHKFFIPREERVNFTIDQTE